VKLLDLEFANSIEPAQCGVKVALYPLTESTQKMERWIQISCYGFLTPPTLIGNYL
jgi:hypothetical protein